MMESTYKICQIFLLMCGVFGADGEVKSVSVMEGDSVTLTPDPDKIQGFFLILWRFGEKGSTIAQIDGKKISYLNYTEIFRGRLQLYQTGSLTIKNMRTEHSGLYKLQVDVTPDKQTFGVKVYESPSVIAEGETELKSVSVTEGDLVTLDVPQIQGDELIVWRFGDEGKLIAKADIENKSSSLYDDEERFRDRLQLNQTGSLIITNTRTTDSGLYTAKISSNKQTSYKRFTVTVSAVPDPGLSGGAVAWIVFGVLLLAAAVAAGVMYYLRPRITYLPSQTWSVSPGDDVTLNPETEIQTGDKVQWLFGDKETLIAEIKGENREKTYDGPDGRFKNRLKLGEKNGSLTIKLILTKHTGHYTLKIRRGRETFYKKFIVSVRKRKITVKEGESVYLEPAKNRKINKDDVIQWLFGDEEQQTLIAEIKIETGEILTHEDVADGRFRDRLQLNKKTGSLTIKNTRTEHSGVYKLEIRSSSGVSEQTITVTVSDKVEEKFLEEDSVTLNPDTEIQRDDQILWMFGDQDKLIAQMKGGTVDDDVNKRFRGRLKLDKMTGSLTITKIEAEHTGLYKLQIISSSGETFVKRFKVLIKPRDVEVTAGDSVHLNTDLTEIQRGNEIEWRFGAENSLIAEIKGGTGETHDGPDERFRDRLELNEKTGDLIIKNSTDEHAGRYKLKIRSSKGNTYRTYSVFIRARIVEVAAGDSVRLHTALTEIQTDDEIEWRFGAENSLIAEIKGGTGVTHDVPDERFRDRLELDKKTGDLIIKNSTTEHTGLYKLKICSSKGNTYRTYIVFIRARKVVVTAGDSVRLHTDLTEIQRDEEIEWRFGDENSLIAEIKGGTGETHDVLGKRFRDRLQLDETTGDLTIKNSTDEHIGEYKLKISSSKGNTYSTYIVFIRARKVAVTEGESVHLNTGLSEIQRDDEIQWRFGAENSLIAKIKGGTRKTHDGPDERFRDRLELDKKTGDLIIKNSRTEHTGRYKLKICSSKGNTNSKYSVTIRYAAVTNEAREKSLLKEKTDSRRNRVNESATVVMPLLDGDYVNVENEEEGTSSL